MAEGLQRKIEYADLKLISSFAMEKFLIFRHGKYRGNMPGEASGFCWQKMRLA